MKFKQNLPALFILLVLAAGLSIFLNLRLAANSFSIRSFSFQPPLFMLVLFTAAFYFILVGAWKLRAAKEKSWSGLVVFLPFSLALLAPLSLRHFITAADLITRLNFLGIAMILGVVFLWITFSKHSSPDKVFFRKIKTKFEHLPLRSRLLVLFLTAFLVYNFGTFVLVSKGLAYAGDEPYYLLTTHSFYQDQDLNLSNNYRDNDYFNFYPPELYKQLRIGAYARFGHKGPDYIYPISQPGVSALVLPQYALSRLFKGRTLIFVIKSSLALWAALLGLQIYLLSLELWDRKKLSFVLWLLYSFTAPILFFAIHIYPEVPMALFAVFIFRKARSSKTLSIPYLLFLGFLLSVFPWFGLKYNMVLYPLLLICLYYFLKQHKLGWKVIYFLALPVLGQGLFFLYIHALYGTYNPVAIYEGVVTENTIRHFREVMWKTPLALRIGSFFDYFLDQRDGLLLYSPWYFFVFPGMIEAFRRNKKDFFALLFIAAPFVLNYAFLAHRQGHSPQGRVLSPLVWIGAIFIGYFLVYNRKKIYMLLFSGFGILSLVTASLLLHNPSALYQPTTHEFTFRGGELFISLSNLYFYLPDFLPSFIKVANLAYIPNFIWLLGIMLFVGGYVWKKELKLPSRLPGIAAVTLIFLLLLSAWFVFYPRMVLLFPTRADYSTGHRIGFYSLTRHQVMKNAGEFKLKKDPELYEFNFTSWRQIQDLALTFGSEQGDYSVEVKLFDEVLYSGFTSREIKTVKVPSPPRYRYKNTYLYRITLRLKGLSDISTADNPYHFVISPVR